MSHRLAFFTIGIMHEPVGHAAYKDFMDRVPGVYAADASAGFTRAPSAISPLGSNPRR